jgi:uncharacterized membrane protein YbaN (DUF454 family)
MISKLLKYVFLIIGTISFVLGFLGIFIPLLPTTPLLLLASFCFVRSSKRINDWLINHRLFGSYINDYLNHRALKKRVKIYALILLWVSLIFSAILISKIYLGIILVIIGTVVSIHIIRLKTML